MISAGRYLPILDYKMCERRLENGAGVLVNQVNPSGQSQVVWTTEPCVLYPELVIDQGVAFANFVGALGDLGCHRRIRPADDAAGVLLVQGGQWVIGPIPQATIPDPLTLGTLTVTGTSTTVNEVITGTLKISNPTAGTITQVIGLDVNNFLVKGAVLGFSVAIYYESATLTSALTPNNPINRSAYATIGSEILDPNNLAHPLNTSTIKVDTAGSYLVFWQGGFTANPTASTPSLNLVINGGIAAFASNRAQRVDSTTGCALSGVHAVTLAVNDLIQVGVNTTALATGNRLTDVKLVLVKYA